jgi:hypothetical protein
MNRCILCITCAFFLHAQTVFILAQDAEEIVVKSISWQAEQKANRLLSGQVQSDPTQKPGEWLEVAATDGKRLIPLLEINDPGVAAPAYMLRGQIRYEGVEGDGFLEMWTHLPDGSAYFTRTLGAIGPMAKLNGTSKWREFTLPFSLQIDQNNSAPAPSKLVLNLFLPGKGRVELGPLELVQLPAGLKSAAWWPESTGGWVGGIFGTLLGLLGATIGIGSKQGLSPRTCLVLVGVGLATGMGLLVAGLIAMLLGQPYPVYYPLLMVGVVAVVVLSITFPTIRAQARQRELRRMQALDIA